MSDFLARLKLYCIFLYSSIDEWMPIFVQACLLIFSFFFGWLCLHQGVRPVLGLPYMLMLSVAFLFWPWPITLYVLADCKSRIDKGVSFAPRHQLAYLPVMLNIGILLWARFAWHNPDPAWRPDYLPVNLAAWCAIGCWPLIISFSRGDRPFFTGLAILSIIWTASCYFVSCMAMSDSWL